MTPDRSTAQGTPILQFSVMMENRVGALSSVVNLLRESMVEVLGLSLMDSVDVSIARMVVSDPDIVEQRFLERGIPYSQTPLVVVELPGGAASLGHCLDTLLQAETNIHFSYALLTQPGHHPLLALHLEDSEFGTAILHQNGFKTLNQEDLSR